MKPIRPTAEAAVDRALREVGLRRGAHSIPSDVTVLCVYRARNAAVVMSLLEPAIAARWDVRLWALDEVHPLLVEWTQGSGPGGKFANCNRLMRQPIPAANWVIVLDDDISFTTGDLRSFAGLCNAAGLSLGQPAHDVSSSYSHAVTVRVRSSVVRRTGFVEIGPCFAMAPAIRPEITPFPEDGMGWGLDAAWSALAKRGFNLGVVDVTRVRHEVPAATDYDSAPEFARRDAMLAAQGVTTVDELAAEVTRWAPWSLRKPAWSRSRGRS